MAAVKKAGIPTKAQKAAAQALLSWSYGPEGGGWSNSAMYLEDNPMGLKWTPGSKVPSYKGFADYTKHGGTTAGFLANLNNLKHSKNPWYQKAFHEILNGNAYWAAYDAAMCGWAGHAGNKRLASQYAASVINLTVNAPRSGSQTHQVAITPSGKALYKGSRRFAG